MRRLGLGGAFRRHRRRAGIALGGTVTPYPMQIHTHRLPPEVRRDCVLGFVEAWARGDEGEPATFADWVRQRFGEGFARHFFFPYNSKLFCAAPDELTADWVGRYVPRPELADVVDGAFGLYRAPVGYNATFLYPRAGGIRMLPDALAAGVPGLRLGTAVTAVSLAGREVELEGGERLPFDALVATAPLTHLAALAVDLPPEARAAAARLRAVAVVNINLGVRGAAPRREHWLYVPEPRFPFYRVGLPSNHGRTGPGRLPHAVRRGERAGWARQRRRTCWSVAWPVSRRSGCCPTAAPWRSSPTPASTRRTSCSTQPAPAPSRPCATRSAPPASSWRDDGRSGSTRRWRTRCGTAPPRPAR